MSVGWSVGWSVRGKNQKSKNQSVLIIFDYLINFGASWREVSMRGGGGKGVRGIGGKEKLIIK